MCASQLNPLLGGPAQAREGARHRGMILRKHSYALLIFLLMYAIATVLGFAAYILVSPTAMLVVVFAVMPVVCALLITGYLVLIRASAADSARETVVLVVLWIVLSIVFDAVTYVLLLPAFTGASPNWGFFAQQSPWIWCAYLILVACGVVGRRLYLRGVLRAPRPEGAAS